MQSNTTPALVQSERAWVATKPCGCVAVVCAEEWLTPKELVDWGRRGYTARLVSNDEVRTMPVRCPAHPRTRQDELFPEDAA